MRRRSGPQGCTWNGSLSREAGGHTLPLTILPASLGRTAVTRSRPPAPHGPRGRAPSHELGTHGPAAMPFPQHGAPGTAPGIPPGSRSLGSSTEKLHPNSGRCGWGPRPRLDRSTLLRGANYQWRAQSQRPLPARARIPKGRPCHLLAESPTGHEHSPLGFALRRVHPAPFRYFPQMKDSSSDYKGNMVINSKGFRREKNH